MILLIDNYDSFSYNLVQLLGSISKEGIRVIRNDELSLEEIKNLLPSKIILSPGPGKPKDAGICEEVVREFKSTTPILGVCLGHQAICELFGATITYARKLMHGKQSLITVDTTSSIFQRLDKKVLVARYHSLVADSSTISEELRVIATDDEGEIMAVQHKKYPIYGLQFHPESVLTPQGRIIMENFLQISIGK